MQTSTIKIPRKLATQLLHIAQQSPDHEICGLVSANNGIPVKCYPIANIAEQSEIRFELDPEQQINAMREMRESREEFFAIYHSHPSAPATPSATDIQMANYDEALYLIISLNTKGVLEMRGFRIKNQTVTEINLQMTEN